MRKLECLLSTVSVNLLVVALPIVPKVKSIFKIMLYIIIFLYEGTGICFKSVIGNLTWKHTDRLAFAAIEERENFSPEKFDDSVHLDLPFWDNLNIDLCFSWKSQLNKYNCHYTIWCNWWRNEEKQWPLFGRILLACCNITVSAQTINSQWNALSHSKYNAFFFRMCSSSTEILAFLQPFISRSICVPVTSSLLGYFFPVLYFKMK